MTEPTEKPRMTKDEMIAEVVKGACLLAYKGFVWLVSSILVLVTASLLALALTACIAVFMSAFGASMTKSTVGDLVNWIAGSSVFSAVWFILLIQFLVEWHKDEE